MSLRPVTLFKVSFRKLTGQNEWDLLGCRKVWLVKGKEAKSSLLVAESLVVLSAHKNRALVSMTYFCDLPKSSSCEWGNF